jgi:AcrR family transcriptional regulator
LSGARVGRIAEKSGLHKRLIYYYFKSKDVLFTAALENAYADIRAAERKLKLINSENLLRGQHVNSLSQAKTTNSSLIETLGAVFDRNLLSPKALDQPLSHMQELVMGYILVN